MKITDIYIKSFGCIKDMRITPGENITVIKGDNESGKSTLAAFIKFIFYGLAQKEKWEGLSEKERYFSWEDNSASGNLTLITKEGKRYRIERELIGTRRSGEQTAIVDLDNGTVIKNEKPCDFFLGGVSSEVFTKTCFVSQHGGSRVYGDQVKTAIENMVTGGSEEADTKNALTLIDKTRTRLLHKNEKGGLIYDISIKQEECRAKRDKGLEIKEQNRALETKLENDKKELARIKNNLQALCRDIDISQAMARVAQIREAIDRKENLEKQKIEFESFLKENTVNGFLPDQNYRKELENINRELEFKEKHIDELIGEIDECQSIRDRLLASSLHIQGINEKKDEVNALLTKQKKQKTGAIVLFALFAVFTILGAFILPPLFILSALSILFAVFFISSYSKTTKSITALYKSFIADDHQEFLKRVDEYAKFKASIEKLDAKEELLKKQLAQFEEEQAKLQNKFDLLACKWRENYNDRNELIGQVWAFLDEYTRKELGINKKELDAKGFRDDYIAKELDILSEKVKGVETPPIPLSMLFAKSSEKKALEGEIEALQASIAKAQTALAANSASLPDIKLLESRLASLNKKREEALLALDAVKLAYSTLEEAAAVTRNRFAPTLSKSASLLSADISNGKYENITVDRDLSVTFFDGERTRSISHLSEGTRAMIYTTFRLGLTAELFSDIPPMIFDESFVFLDNRRLTNLLQAINQYCSSNGAQAFIFTCTDRESDILDGMENSNLTQIKL